MSNPTLEFARKLTDQRVRTALQSVLETDTADWWQLQVDNYRATGRPITDAEWATVSDLLLEGTHLADRLDVNPTEFLKHAAAVGSQQSMAGQIAAAERAAGRDD